MLHFIVSSIHEGGGRIIGHELKNNENKNNFGKIYVFICHPNTGPATELMVFGATTEFD